MPVGVWRARVALGGALAIAVILVFASAGAGQASAAADVNCSDFSSQAAAQQYFDDHGPGDPAGLDGDGDGVACESNPCPCSQAGGGGGGQGGSGGNGGSSSAESSGSAKVISVTDGDTVKVQQKGTEEDVRLIGIDTPEVYFGEECGGEAASESMDGLLAPGDRVKLIRDRSQDDRDRYGRLLRYVEKKGRDVGRKQLHRGLAEVYVFETPFERVRSYRRQRDEAEAHNRGSWKTCHGDFHLPV